MKFKRDPLTYAYLSNQYIHTPWKAPSHVLQRAGVQLGVTYPERIVKDLPREREASVEAVLRYVRERVSERETERNRERETDRERERERGKAEKEGDYGCVGVDSSL